MYIKRGTLTKYVFMGLPTGMLLVSNCGKPWKPIFSERIAPPSQRDAQWRRIVASAAAGRCFMMFADEKGYAEMMTKLGFSEPPEPTSEIAIAE
ncbi:MAG: hypothetical protein U1G07_12445 [Verrucomicrobiota bacterium]